MASTSKGECVESGSPPLATFKTPLKPRTARKPAARTPLTCGKFAKIEIPASPFLWRLGFGTGVSVYSLERSPDPRGAVRSPWAVKKLNKWYRNRPSHQQKCLMSEAAVLRTISHPHIIGFRGYLENEGRNPVLLMEKGGQSLLDMIEERSGTTLDVFKPPQIMKVGRDVALALAYLHNEKRLLHGDLKSANVLVCGDFDNVKLCDFGVTVRLNDALESCDRDEYVGTYHWSAKEVLEPALGHKITHKSDIYAYGLVIYEMLTLQLPHCEPVEDDDDECDEDSSGDDDELVDTTGDLLEEDVCDSSETARVGTRPLLPVELNSVYASDPGYNDAIALFFACASEDPDERPSAEELLHAFEAESMARLVQSDGE